jgi:DNA (cytosine-5)-methyltransferase 1
LDQRPTFYEFFAGGGMARAGLGDGWRCAFANDFDPKKATSYKANWGDAELKVGDIHALRLSDLPGQADLAWASFPCQDLSLAGNGKGLAGERSGAFWGFWTLMNGLKADSRAPALLVLENVTGALTANKGKDFGELCRALKLLGYSYGALVIDAVRFLPQSRPRLFIVAVRAGHSIPAFLRGDGPQPEWSPLALTRAHAALSPDLRPSWIWWRLPNPLPVKLSLIDVIEAEPTGVRWHKAEETARLVSMMSRQNLWKLGAAKAERKRVVGTIYKRTREDEGERRQRAELRFDGVAGCLRTPGGGSSRQLVIEVIGDQVRTRLLSASEAARLMGLSDGYILPENYNEAYHLLGDGLAVPVVSFLARTLLEIILTPQQIMVAAE